MTTARARVAWTLALTALLTGCGAGDPAGSAPRLVLLYATCTLNKDFLSPYDSRVPYTPNLARFADEAVVFERHVTEAGVSGIAYASIFTGSQADRHGVYRHPMVLADELYLVTEAFADAGYEPFFWNAHRMAAPDLNYAQGVPPENAYSSHAEKKRMLSEDDPRFLAVLERLRADPDYRALLVVNFTVTHAAYSKQVSPTEVLEFMRSFPEESEGVTLDEIERLIPLYEENRLALQWNYPTKVAELGLSDADQEALARVLAVYYRAAVRELDRLFGRTLDTLADHEVAGESLVAFTADHGEMLHRDNALYFWGHGLQLVPEVLDVPWILSAPGLAPGRYPGVTRSIDVYPTLAGLCRIELPESAPVDGADLSAALRGHEAAPELRAFSHSKILGPRLLEEFEGWEHVGRYFPRADPELMWVTVRAEDAFYKLRHLGDEEWALEVYDLASDPEERDDLFDAANESHTAARGLLEHYKRRLVEGFDVLDVEAAQMDADVESRLRDLGYIGDG